MSKEKSFIEETIKRLKQERDDLALQIHLGAAEAKEEFNKAKERLDKMAEDYEPVKDAVGESAGNVLAALKLVGEELVGSFERIRKSVK